MKKLMLLALAVIMALAPACAHRKAAKLVSIRQGMTMGQVSAVLGEPDITTSSVDSQGRVIDVWEYSLGIRDEGKHKTKVVMQVCGWLLFWPLLCFPHAWESSWTFETYFLKFVNKMLHKWGKKIDISDVQKEYSKIF